MTSFLLGISISLTLSQSQTTCSRFLRTCDNLISSQQSYDPHTKRFHLKIPGIGTSKCCAAFPEQYHHVVCDQINYAHNCAVPGILGSDGVRRFVCGNFMGTIELRLQCHSTTTLPIPTQHPTQHRTPTRLMTTLPTNTLRIKRSTTTTKPSLSDPPACDFNTSFSLGSHEHRDIELEIPTLFHRNRAVIISTCGSNFDTTLRVFNSMNISVAFDDDGSGSYPGCLRATSRIVFYPVSYKSNPFKLAEKYVIRVAGYKTDYGNVKLTISCALPPTSSPTAPPNPRPTQSHICGVYSGTIRTGEHLVFTLETQSSWYIQLKTCGSNFDTVLNMKSMNNRQIAHNDDGSFACPSCPRCSSIESKWSVYPTLNRYTNYTVELTGYKNSVSNGHYKLSLMCDSRAALRKTSSWIQPTNFLTCSYNSITTDFLPPRMRYTLSVSSYQYDYFEVNTCHSSFDTKLTLYEWPERKLQSNNDSVFCSSVSVHDIAYGGSYYVDVTSVNKSQMPTRLNLTMLCRVKKVPGVPTKIANTPVITGEAGLLIAMAVCFGCLLPMYVLVRSLRCRADASNGENDEENHALDDNSDGEGEDKPSHQGHEGEPGQLEIPPMNVDFLPQDMGPGYVGRDKPAAAYAFMDDGERDVSRLETPLIAQEGVGQ